MLEIYEHNKSDCIKLLNMIICEIPFIKSFSDDCLLERLLNLISVISNAFDNPNNRSFDPNIFDCEDKREVAIREWLLRHYNAKCLIDDLDFKDIEDRTRITVLIINILFKLRHSLKDIEQYLKDCDSFVHFDKQLNDITRFDKLLEIIESDSNRWKSEARYYKVKYDESKKLIEKYQQNEIFNYNSNPRNQYLYKSRISLNNGSNNCKEVDTKEDNNISDSTNDCQQSCQSFLNRINGLNDKQIKNVSHIDIVYLCVECDQKYSTKFEYNLHVLRDHKHFDISHIILDSNNKTHNKRTDISKNCNHFENKSFKCIYKNCGKTFDNSHELKTHFIRHQPKIDRFLYVYSHHTNAVLNRLRTHNLNTRHLFNDLKSVEKNIKTPKKLKFNESNGIDFDYNIEMELNVNKYQFSNGFGIDSELYSNDLRAVPLCKTEPQIDFQEIDSFEYFN